MKCDILQGISITVMFIVGLHMQYSLMFVVFFPGLTINQLSVIINISQLSCCNLLKKA